MTDCIEEMIKMAGIEPNYKYQIKGTTFTSTVCKKWLINHFKDRKEKSVFKVVKVDKLYPDFTPEKQLEIENLIIKKKFAVWNFDKNADIPQYTPFGYFMEDNKISCICGSSTSFKKATANNRKQALAQLTTELMKTKELDKEKVKEILEK